MLAPQDLRSDETRLRRCMVWAVAVLMIGIAIYPLSVGPVYVVCQRIGVNTGTVWQMYRPLIFLCEATHSKSLLSGYTAWWFSVTWTQEPLFLFPK